MAITPYFLVDNGHAAAAFYREVMGAEPTFTRDNGKGGIAHMTLGSPAGPMMLADDGEWGKWSDLPRGPDSAVGWLAFLVDDVDATFEKAIQAGATPEVPPYDTAWGERYARFRDPFGQLWAISPKPGSDAA